MTGKLLRAPICLARFLGIVATAFLLPASCPAHILQYLTWFKIERQITVSPGQVRVIHDCRFDPVMFRPADAMMDRDGDSTASQSEIAEFCLEAGKYLAQDFAVVIAEAPCQTRQESFFVYDDSSGFRSEIVSAVPMRPGTTQTLEILDPSYIFPAPPSPDAAATTGTARVEGEELLLVDGKNLLQRQIHTYQEVRTTLIVVLSGRDDETTKTR